MDVDVRWVCVGVRLAGCRQFDEVVQWRGCLG